MMASLAQMLDEDRLGVDPEAWRKFDPSLRRAVSDLGPGSDVEFPVLIVLDLPSLESSAPDGVDRASWLVDQERAFEEASAGVRRTIEEAGPFDVCPNWLARAFAARVPVPVLEAVARRPEVRHVVLDVPRKLIQEPEGRHA